MRIFCIFLSPIFIVIVIFFFRIPLVQFAFFPSSIFDFETKAIYHTLSPLIKCEQYAFVFDDTDRSIDSIWGILEAYGSFGPLRERVAGGGGDHVTVPMSKDTLFVSISGTLEKKKKHQRANAFVGKLIETFPQIRMDLCLVYLEEWLGATLHYVCLGFSPWYTLLFLSLSTSVLIFLLSLYTFVLIYSFTFSLFLYLCINSYSFTFYLCSNLFFHFLTFILSLSLSRSIFILSLSASIFILILSLSID